MESLQDTHISFKFILEDLADDDILTNWLINAGLITDKYECPKCNNMMQLQKLVSQQGFAWRCRRGSNHEIRRSIRRGSWFENSKMTLRDILLLTYMWSLKMTSESILSDMKISTKTLVDWKNACRDLCVEMCIRENEMLGGEETIVEIDECKFGRKHNLPKSMHGKVPQGNWGFGGMEKGTNRTFLYLVERKGKDKFLEIIEKFILPGTTVISECWRTYDCINDENFKQLAERNSLQFQEPAKNANIFSIEGAWNALKRTMIGTNHCSGQFDSYLFEYVCRKRYQGKNIRFINGFLQSVAEIYKPTCKD